jgi:hypothetical protein
MVSPHARYGASFVILDAVLVYSVILLANEVGQTASLFPETERRYV